MQCVCAVIEHAACNLHLSAYPVTPMDCPCIVCIKVYSETELRSCSIC